MKIFVKPDLRLSAAAAPASSREHDPAIAEDGGLAALGVSVNTIPEGWDDTNDDTPKVGGFDELLNKALGLTVVWDRPELARQPYVETASLPMR